MANYVKMNRQEYLDFLAKESNNGDAFYVSQNRINKMKKRNFKKIILEYIQEEYNGEIYTNDIPSIARYFNTSSQQITGFCSDLARYNKIIYNTKSTSTSVYRKILSYMENTKTYKISIYELATQIGFSVSEIQAAINFTNNSYEGCISKYFVERLHGLPLYISPYSKNERDDMGRIIKYVSYKVKE